MPLFAEVPDWAVWVVATIGPAIAWAATWYAGKRAESRKEKKEDQKDIVEHQTDLIERQGQEIDKLRARADETDRLVQRLMQHVGYLEGVMTAKGEKFTPFSFEPISESNTHAPLRQGGT